MAYTLTLTPEPAQGRVKVQLAGTWTNPVGLVANAPPVTYTVRGSPFTATTATVVYDYDCPLGTDVVYTATDNLGAQASATVRLDVGGFWLASMTSPATAHVQPVVLSDHDQAWAGRGVAHDVLGTPEPLVTMQVAAYRNGVMDLWVATVDEWAPIRDLLLGGDVLLLRSPCPSEVADTAMLVEEVTADLPWNTAPARPRTVSVSYRSVRRDVGPPYSADWTFGVLKATYASFGAVKQRFATFGSLTAGPPPPTRAGDDPGIELGW